jgi:hypothetical protein
MPRALRQTVLAGILSVSYLAFSQTAKPAQGSSPPPAPSTAAAAQRVDANGCIRPAPLPSADDYNGPFNKLVVRFSRKLDIRTVSLPRGPRYYQRICSLDAGQKFRLFIMDTIEPVTFAGAGVSAGIAQASDDDPSFGQGAAGYGKRYAVAFLDSSSSNFFHTFFFPALFRQDPRYYRWDQGTSEGRLGHALQHTVITRSDGGKKMVNFSEWLGTVSADALGTIYHPGARRGVSAAAIRDSISIGTDMGFDVLREFWPEIARKFKLPFRTRAQAPSSNGGDPTQK